MSAPEPQPTSAASSANHADDTSPWPRIDSAADLADVLRPLMRAVAAAVGPHCELVLRDLSGGDPDGTITAIEPGDDGREPAAEAGAGTGADSGDGFGDGFGVDRHGQLARTDDGRELRGSVAHIRGADGRPVAALDVTVDLTPVQAARNALDRLLPEADLPHAEESTATDITEVLDQLIESAIASTGKTVALMDRSDKVAVLRFLDAKGAFFVKRAVDRVARRLGISRVTAYNYLEQVRAS